MNKKEEKTNDKKKKIENKENLYKKKKRESKKKNFRLTNALEKEKQCTLVPTKHACSRTYVYSISDSFPQTDSYFKAIIGDHYANHPSKKGKCSFKPPGSYTNANSIVIHAFSAQKCFTKKEVYGACRLLLNRNKKKDKDQILEEFAEWNNS